MTTVHAADPPRRFQELARRARRRSPAWPARHDARARADGTEATPASATTADVPDVSDLIRRAGPQRARVVASSSSASASPSRHVAASTTPEEAAAAAAEHRRRPARRQARRSRRTRREQEASCSAWPRRRKRPRSPSASAARCSSRARLEPGDEVLCGMTRDATSGRSWPSGEAASRSRSSTDVVALERPAGRRRRGAPRRRGGHR